MRRVLVVDDDQAIRELLRVVLELEGYQVVTASDGSQALELLTCSDEPWIVLMDVMMPRMSGLDVCRRLEASGASAERHSLALMTAGLLDERDYPPPARALLRKPFDLDAVVRLIGTLARGGEGMEVTSLASCGLPCEAQMAASS